MANSNDTPWWRDITKVLMFITAVTGFVTAVQTQCNQQQIADGNRRIEYVTMVQQDQVMNTEVIKNDLKTATEKNDEKLRNIEYKTQVIDAKLPKKNP